MLTLSKREGGFGCEHFFAWDFISFLAVHFLDPHFILGGPHQGDHSNGVPTESISPRPYSPASFSDAFIRYKASMPGGPFRRSFTSQRTPREPATFPAAANQEIRRGRTLIMTIRKREKAEAIMKDWWKAALKQLRLIKVCKPPEPSLNRVYETTGRLSVCTMESIAMRIWFSD